MFYHFLNKKKINEFCQGQWMVRGTKFKGPNGHMNK